MFILPRRWRIACFFIVTPWQLVVILTANYTFLNYLVLALGIFLLDDRFLQQFIPERWKQNWTTSPFVRTVQAVKPGESPNDAPPEARDATDANEMQPESAVRPDWTHSMHHILANVQLTLTCVMFAWLFYASTTLLVWMLWRSAPLPSGPIVALEPFRIADRYGLFARMTR